MLPLFSYQIVKRKLTRLSILTKMAKMSQPLKCKSSDESVSDIEERMDLEPSNNNFIKSCDYYYYYYYSYSHLSALFGRVAAGPEGRPGKPP